METKSTLDKNIFNKSRTTPTPVEPEPKEIYTVTSEDKILYIKHLKYLIFNLETDKLKLEDKLNKTRSIYYQFRTKYFDIVNSMKKYSKLDRFSNFIDLPQEEVNDLIKYRKAWIKFKERRKDLLGKIKIGKDKLAIIDINLDKEKKLLNTLE